MHNQQRAATDVPEHPEEKKRQEMLTTLIRDWSERIKVHIRYQSLTSRSPLSHTVCPYLIEPSLWSDNVYVIAKTNVTDSVTPFQLERIEKATLSTETFEVDPKFAEETLFPEGRSGATPLHCWVAGSQFERRWCVMT